MWLGPAIGPSAFEVGSEVRDAFVVGDVAAAAAFVPRRRGRWLANLYLLAGSACGARVCAIFTAADVAR